MAIASWTSGTMASGVRTSGTGLALRATGMALGLLFGALLTASAASAQTADLAVSQATATNTFNAGDTVNVTVTVTNHGPSAASNVAMVNFFPPDNNGASGGSA